ncbi:hypothetical protein KM043_010343 [Ampulex compressa]|nr:hypothetical protein KM043_010343 [Ampulex compressa]
MAGWEIKAGVERDVNEGRDKGGDGCVGEEKEESGEKNKAPAAGRKGRPEERGGEAEDMEADEERVESRKCDMQYEIKGRARYGR